MDAIEAKPGPGPGPGPGLEITAYRVHEAEMPLAPAGREREWMEALPQRYANRCLPLRIANESGWWILNGHTFDVLWDGGQHQSSLKLNYEGGTPEHVPASSHFGGGILTFSLPYLFRTSPGYNLSFRGPANMPKHGATALEGVVETDWAPYTATMSWRITSVGEPVRFERDEPICQLVPQRRGELEAFEPTLAPVSANKQLEAQYTAWTEYREVFLRGLSEGDAEILRQSWQRDYFQGRISGERRGERRAERRGDSAPEHQTKLRLRSFNQDPDSSGAGDQKEGV